MRLFVSVDLDGIADAVSGVQDPLSELPGLRLTDPGQAHVTMKFLGAGEHDLEALSNAIETAVSDAEIDPFKTTFEGVGAFPSAEYIRVLWLGVGRGTSELTALHRRIEAETTTLGYDEERHEFTPHVTLARMEHAAAKGEVQRFLREADPDVGPLRVEELRLKESRSTDDGPKYRTVEQFRV